MTEYGKKKQIELPPLPIIAIAMVIMAGIVGIALYATQSSSVSLVGPNQPQQPVPTLPPAVTPVSTEKATKETSVMTASGLVIIKGPVKIMDVSEEGFAWSNPDIQKSGTVYVYTANNVGIITEMILDIKTVDLPKYLSLPNGVTFSNFRIIGQDKGNNCAQLVADVDIGNSHKLVRVNNYYALSDLPFSREHKEHVVYSAPGGSGSKTGTSQESWILAQTNKWDKTRYFLVEIQTPLQ